MNGSATGPHTPRAADISASGAPPRALNCLVVEDHTLIGQWLVGILRASPGIGGVRLATTTAVNSPAAVALAGSLGLFAEPCRSPCHE